MAIVTEDGTGLSNAQTYCDYPYFQAFMAERGLTFTQTQVQVEAALVVAAKDWIDGEHDFAGEKLVSSQALQFPRVFDDATLDQFPEAIKQANAHAAHLHLRSGLLVDTTAISTSGAIASESKSTGPLSKSVEYVSGTQQIYSRVLPKRQIKLLKPYLFSGGMTLVKRW